MVITLLFYTIYFLLLQTQYLALPMFSIELWSLQLMYGNTVLQIESTYACALRSVRDE